MNSITCESELLSAKYPPVSQQPSTPALAVKQQAPHCGESASKLRVRKIPRSNL